MRHIIWYAFVMLCNEIVNQCNNSIMLAVPGSGILFDSDVLNKTQMFSFSDFYPIISLSLLLTWQILSSLTGSMKSWLLFYLIYFCVCVIRTHLFTVGPRLGILCNSWFTLKCMTCSILRWPIHAT